VVYLGVLGLVWYITGCYEIFFALTSFVHYCRCVFISAMILLQIMSVSVGL
jgi:hypothetical protein